MVWKYSGLQMKHWLGIGQHSNLSPGPQPSSPSLEKFSPPLEKCVGHRLKPLDIVQKIWAPLRKLFAPPGVPSSLRACLSVICWGLLVHDFGMLVFCFEDAVVENPIIVLQAHCDMNVKLVVRYCNECNGYGKKITVRPCTMYTVYVSICAFKWK